MRNKIVFPALLLATALSGSAPAQPVSYSGIYPHLAFYNDDNECGTGAVVPWSDRLWAITYSPHRPYGSSDKLYEIDSDLKRTIRPESTGGTHASRMIHDESDQLFIGPYVIDSQRKVRAIPHEVMPGRLTGTARHLTDPAGKVYYATMEEGFYEVDVDTLAVKELYPDANRDADHGGNLLPGYHGKGLATAQGRLVYVNNGERGEEALRNPNTPSGALAEWDGTTWTVIRRNQFTEVTGPEGIRPTDASTSAPLWSIGWDHRSLILMVLKDGEWSQFRLPKGSHSYDGAHGWNTEWPRIREIGEDHLLMTMHGTFWRFPKSFSKTNTAGISPRSNYLKVIGDFCRWNDRLVFGCDDAAKSEFLNKRKAKGEVAGPGVSQSNLWFVEPETLDQLGPVIGRGAVWLNDTVKAGGFSDPFLVNGYDLKSLHLSHEGGRPVRIGLEVDTLGDGKWSKLDNLTVPASGYLWHELPGQPQWVRLRAIDDCSSLTAYFHLRDSDQRTTATNPMFTGMATPEDDDYSGGILRAGGLPGVKLEFAAIQVRNSNRAGEGYYEMGADMRLKRVESTTASQWLQDHAAVPHGILLSDEASIIFEDHGRRYRLPKGSADYKTSPPITLRIAREVTTERDLFNAGGTFYELPADNAGGFAKIRPVSTHNRLITDYCSWRGLLVISGVAAGNPENGRIITSNDRQCAVWVGSVDDLWKMGKAVGSGGPWKNTAVRAGQPSDPYLMTGYDRKSLTLEHEHKKPVEVTVEVDISGNGDWKTYRTFPVAAGDTVRHEFPDAFGAYWVRVTADTDCNATAWLEYR